MDVKSLLKSAYIDLKGVSDVPKLESELLLSYVLNVKREKLYLIEDNLVDDYSSKKFTDCIEKRKKGYPFFYIIGRREFMGLEFEVREGVLIPRPETEIIVLESLKVANGHKMHVIDVGTGSGCIILSFLYYNKLSRGIGIDISKRAIKLASTNAKKFNLGDRAKFLKVDFFIYKPDEKFDIIVANPPYVKTERVKDVKYEPHMSLNGGKDGFGFYPSFFMRSFSMLSNGGFLFAEIDDDMGERSVQIMKETGFRDIKIIKDLSGLDRVICGMK
jgi:release factor glutamine methyltransferase